MSTTHLDADQIRVLPAVVDVPTAAYELIRTGSWPTPVVRLGKLIRVPTAPLLDLVGVHR